MFNGIPRWLMAFGIVLIVVIELGSRLPDIMLLPQRLAGTTGEMEAKTLAPQLQQAQIDKTIAEARATDVQARLNAMLQAKANADTKVAELTQDKVVAETKVQQYQQEVTQLQGRLLTAQTAQAQSQATLLDTQAAKTVAETKVAQLNYYLTIAQTDQTRAQADSFRAQAAQANAQATKTNLDNLGTVVAGALLLGGTAYVADKMGWLPENRSARTSSNDDSSYPTATIKTSGANIRKCAGKKCEIVNRGDPLTQGTKVIAMNVTEFDEDRQPWYLIKGQTSKGTYSGYVSATVLDYP